MKSRDDWKAKATQRKALEIRIRDLEVSRELHRLKAERLQKRLNQPETQIADAARPEQTRTDVDRVPQPG